MKKIKQNNILWYVKFEWNSDFCFYWNAAMPLHLCFVCGCFYSVMAELSSRDRPYVVLSVLQTVGSMCDKAQWYSYNLTAFQVPAVLLYCDSFIFCYQCTHHVKTRRENWTLNVALLGHNGMSIVLTKCKASCLSCNDIIALLKEYKYTLTLL